MSVGDKKCDRESGIKNGNGGVFSTGNVQIKWIKLVKDSPPSGPSQQRAYFQGIESGGAVKRGYLELNAEGDAAEVNKLVVSMITGKTLQYNEGTSPISFAWSDSFSIGDESWSSTTLQKVHLKANSLTNPV